MSEAPADSSIVTATDPRPSVEVDESEVVIRMRGVCKAFGTKTILKDFDLDVHRGEAFCIMGQSGIGKSVSLRHVIGLLKSDRGEVQVDGVDMNSVDRDGLQGLRAKMGYVFQEAALLNWLSAGENVALPLRETTNLPDDEIRQRVHEKLSLVHVPDAYDKLPGELSGGMKKRVGLARALITNPEIILYDEPTAGLDPEISSSINHLMRELSDRLGVTALIVTHHIGCVKTVADRVGLLDGGRLQYVSTPEEFLSSEEPRLVRFLGDRLD